MTLICVDCETTGLSPSDAGIVDLAAVAVRDGEIVDRFSTLVWPGRAFLQARHRDVLAKVSGISALELLNETVPEVVPACGRFLQWLEPLECRGLTSFNVAFDRAFLSAEPWRIPPVWTDCLMLAAMGPMREAGALVARYDGSEKWPSLREACRFFNVPFVETHRALADAEAAARLAVALGMGG